VVVHPADRKQGLGSTLYAACLKIIRDGGGTEITTGVRGEDNASAAWAEHRGFVFDRQRTESTLDLKDWNSERWADSVAQVRESQ
jgi:ribosomal protein S18 acetylase RimI-like enzyme